jgi:uncharacterized protein
VSLRNRAILSCVVGVLALGGADLAAAQSAPPNEIVISEFRTRGPQGGNDEFVELRNRSAVPVNIAGWRLQGCASGSPGTASNRVTVGSDALLPAGGSYLFANDGSSGYSGSVAPDATYGTGFTDFSTTNFAGIRIVDTAGTVRDGVGSPNSPCREGTGILTPTTNGDNSFERLGGTTDTNNNLPDFEGPKPGNPQNSGPPLPPLRSIPEIQGAAHISPFNGQAVRTDGIVTVKRPSSFYLQNPTPDGDATTSEGILVFGSAAAAAVSVGHAVRVRGNITEFRPGGTGGVDNLTITQIGSPTVTVLSVGNPAPTPTVLGLGGRMPPTELIDPGTPSGSVETSGAFDATAHGIDFYESLESMLVQVNRGAVVNETESFGEITLLPDNGEWATGLRTPRGGILYRYEDGNPERIAVDDEILRDQISPRPPSAMPAMNVGDDLTAPVVGPLDYTFENFKIQALSTPVFVSGGLQPEATRAMTDHEIAVATYNVENLDPSDTSFGRHAQLIVDHLRSPDLIAIEEVQDNSGASDTGVVDASVTWQMLIDAIVAAGGPQYEYRQIDPENNADGGAPGANIRVGFLFRTDRGLSFVDSPGGDATTPTEVVSTLSGPQLSLSPGRVDPENDAWFATRKPLAGEFRMRGRKVFVIANHLSSKTDDQGLFSRWQPPTRFSEQPDADGLGGRHAQAQVLNDFVDEILAADSRANVIVLGDINDFEFSETVDILEGGGVLTTLVDTLPVNERYSYVFEGNSQTLDQILLSDNLLDHFRAEYDVVHVNSEFAGQASDHEPSVARLDLRGRPGPK